MIISGKAATFEHLEKQTNVVYLGELLRMCEDFGFKLTKAKVTEIFKRVSYNSRELTFEEFKAAVPKDQPRFLLYDYEKKLEDGQNKSKMIFALYCPDSLPIAKKIPYTSSVMSVQGAAPHTSHIQVRYD